MSRTAAPAVQTIGYRPELDGLRGVAVLAVMLYHFGLPWAKGGFLGVDVFFVLSGFLITSRLVEEWRATGTVRLRRFYARRALRLLPAAALLLAVTAPFVDRLWTLSAIVYVANWPLALGYLGPGPISHLWSLAVEEQFYLVWPVVLAGLLRAGAPRWSIVAGVAALAAGSAALKVLAWRAPLSWVRLYHGSDTRADALLIGCDIALIVAWGLLPSTGRLRRALSGAAVLGAAGLVWLGLTTPLDEAFLYRRGGLTLAALAAGAIVLDVVQARGRGPRAVLAWPPLVAVGRISYGLYLWHYPIRWVPSPWLVGSASKVGLLALRLAASFAAALVSYVVIERPALRVKRRFVGGAGAPPVS